MAKVVEVSKKVLDHIDSLKNKYNGYKTEWGWNGLGYLIYKRTYARGLFKRKHKQKWVYEDNLTPYERNNVQKLIADGELHFRTEEWNETVARVIRGSLKLGTPYSFEEIERMFAYMMDLKMSTSGRFLWQSDSKLPNMGIYDSLLNCWFHTVDNTKVFSKVFEQLMLGGGVGFSVQREYIKNLPTIQFGEVTLNNDLSKNDVIINILNLKGLNNLAYEYEQQEEVNYSQELITELKAIKEFGYLDEIVHESLSVDRILYVGDSREGWIKLLEEIMRIYFGNGGVLQFNTSLIRQKGELILGFGGKASGDKELIKGMLDIVSLLKNAVGRQLGSVEVMDIICMIAEIVVSGNVRRSALLALSDNDDVDFITCKRYDLKEVPFYRSKVNISVQTDDTSKLPNEFWDSFRALGEPIGLFNVENARNWGRMGSNRWNDLKNIFQDRNKNFFNFNGETTIETEDGMRLFKADPMVKGANPCYKGITAVMTPQGISTIADIKKGDMIWSKEGWTKVLDKWSNGIKPTYRYRTTSSVFYGTEDHKIFSNGEKIKVGEADSIDLILGSADINYNKFDPQIVMDGLVFGDGYYSSYAPSDRSPYLGIGINDQDYFKSEVAHLIIGRAIKSNEVTHKVITNIKMGEFGTVYDKVIPQRYKTFENIQSFLRGLYSANGSVCGKRVTFKTVNAKLAEDIQIMLNAIGISSFFTTNKEKGVQHHNGYFIGAESYDVNITRVDQFLEKIGFLQEYKNEKIREIIRKKTKFMDFKQKACEIRSVEYVGEDEVFDIAVDNESHSLWTSGCDVSNCFDAKQYVLTPNGLKHIQDINIGDEIWGLNDWTKVTNKWSNGIKEVWNVKTDKGSFLGTLNHRVFENNVKKEIKDCRTIDSFIQTSDNILKSQTCSIMPSKVLSKIYIGRDEVFDLTVDNETHSFWSDNLHVSNCAEMNGDSGENCNLTVINIARVKDLNELKDIAVLLYKLQKQITQGDYLFKDDQAKINANSRIGMGITGVLSDFDKHKEWASELYTYLREYDKQYSEEMNYPQSIKLTVQKPDGTLGLLMGTKAGIHLDNSPFWYRTVRFASNDPLVEICRKKGYRIEKDVMNSNNFVVYFACKSDTPNKTEMNTSAIEQIDYNIEWQEAFVDQSVSQTVKYKKEELESIIYYLDKKFKDNIKAISFLQFSNDNFPQQPYQTITEKEYNDYIASVQDLNDIDLSEDVYEIEVDEGGCEGGACPIK